MSAPTFWLGGVSTTPWLSKRRIVSLVLLLVSAVLVMVLILLLRSLALVIVLMLLGVAFAVLMTRRSMDGSMWGLTVGDQLRAAIARRARWDDFDPALEPVPFAVPEPVNVLTVESDSSATAGILQYPDSMVCVLEVSGSGEGVQTEGQPLRTRQRVISLHEALADPRSCVEELDWITLVRETDPGELAAQVESRLDMSIPKVLQDSVKELPLMIAEATWRYRSYVVIRMNIDRLFAFVAERPWTKDSGPDAALAATEAVARQLELKGFPVLNVLSAPQIAGLSRAILDPDRSPDDTSGCEDFWPGLPAWHGTADAGITVQGMMGEWRHATAGMDRENWPQNPVDGRWLETLLFAPPSQSVNWAGGGVGPRTIAAKFRLLPRAEARELARDQSTTAKSRRVQRRRQGVIDGGEADAADSMADRVASDITVNRHVGLMPDLRVMVAGQTAHQLRQARDVTTSIFQDQMGAEGVSWDSRPGPSLVRLMPWGVKVAQR